jgi:hypothetical protein
MILHPGDYTVATGRNPNRVDAKNLVEAGNP